MILCTGIKPLTSQLSAGFVSSLPSVFENANLILYKSSAHVSTTHPFAFIAFPHPFATRDPFFLQECRRGLAEKINARILNGRA